MVIRADYLSITQLLDYIILSIFSRSENDSKCLYLYIKPTPPSVSSSWSLQREPNPSSWLWIGPKPWISSAYPEFVWIWIIPTALRAWFSPLHHPTEMAIKSLQIELSRERPKCQEYSIERRFYSHRSTCFYYDKMRFNSSFPENGTLFSTWIHK